MLQRSDGKAFHIFDPVVLKNAFYILLVLKHNVIAMPLWHDLHCLSLLLFGSKWTNSER